MFNKEKTNMICVGCIWEDDCRELFGDQILDCSFYTCYDDDPDVSYYDEDLRWRGDYYAQLVNEQQS